jgi:hypothetical protein
MYIYGPKVNSNLIMQLPNPVDKF